ncbi:MAG: 4-hydroxy-3-methylbut-2-enyl diphosphate reductase [Deltaproteobacteria bacterium]|nr:4-hydroxy-3-methylbut-2-enyl diphosphate reductase [Deltaproteobacteria bacterium]
MEILIAKSAGFCFGVKRAINMATDCAEVSDGEISTLGPIIHNPQVVDKLDKESNIKITESVEDMKSGTIILRSHGAKLSERKTAEKKGLKVLDATCPFVKKTQEFVSELTADGYTVIVVGEKEHPEVRGIVSYGKEEIIVAASVGELEGLSQCSKIGIVAQTTQSQENLQAITAYCVPKAKEIKVFNTICSATSVRQKESVELSKLVDSMIVVGGKNSANTRRMADICRSIQPKTYHIETADEIEESWFVGINRLGVTAGASTPNWIIEEVIERVS